MAIRHDEPVDLCSTCTSEFQAWLRPSRFELATEGATATTVDLGEQRNSRFTRGIPELGPQSPLTADEY
jgi:hypothetical protein